MYLLTSALINSPIGTQYALVANKKAGFFFFFFISFSSAGRERNRAIEASFFTAAVAKAGIFQLSVVVRPTAAGTSSCSGSLAASRPFFPPAFPPLFSSLLLPELSWKCPHYGWGIFLPEPILLRGGKRKEGTRRQRGIFCCSWKRKKNVSLVIIGKKESKSTENPQTKPVGSQSNPRNIGKTTITASDIGEQERAVWSR